MPTPHLLFYSKKKSSLEAEPRLQQEKEWICILQTVQFKVHEYCESISIQTLWQILYNKNQDQPFFFDVGIILFGIREHSWNVTYCLLTPTFHYISHYSFQSIGRRVYLDRSKWVRSIVLCMVQDKAFWGKNHTPLQYTHIVRGHSHLYMRFGCRGWNKNGIYLISCQIIAQGYFIVRGTHKSRHMCGRLKNSWPRQHSPNEAPQALHSKLSPTCRQRPGGQPPEAKS